MHYHLIFTEAFELLEGRLNVDLDGRHLVLGPGEKALAPIKARHRKRDAARFRIPALSFKQPFRTRLSRGGPFRRGPHHQAARRSPSGWVLRWAAPRPARGTS